MSDTAEFDEEPAIKLFGDPRAKFVERGPDRRIEQTIAPATMSRELLPRPAGPPASSGLRSIDPSHAVRLGRGDGVATALTVLGVMVFGATTIAGTLILYNAKNVGAFSNPWDSTRVAIGLAVLAVGIVQSAILIGLSRAVSYLLAILRLRSIDAQELHSAGSTRNGD